MVSDNEPRYRLLDSTDAVVGSIYEQTDGSLALQEASSENEIVLEDDGSVRVNADTIFDGVVGEIPDSALGTVDAGTVNLGRGLEDDGSGQVQFDEDTSFSFTVSQDFNSGLSISQGQSIRDASGTGRLFYLNGSTILTDETGTTGIRLASNDAIRLDARSGRTVDIQDEEGGFTALSYLSDSTSPGQLFLPNVEIATDLRFQTGQSLRETGGSTERMTLAPAGTFVNDDQGRTAFRASDAVNRINVYSGGEFEVFDRDGGFQAFGYNPSSASPGTLSLDNALLVARGAADAGGETDVGIQLPSDPAKASVSQKIVFTNDDGESVRLFMENGELKATDDGANDTTLT